MQSSQYFNHDIHLSFNIFKKYFVCLLCCEIAVKTRFWEDKIYISGDFMQQGFFKCLCV